MITMAQLKAWGLAASIVTSGGHVKLSDRVLTGMATAALANPVTAGDDGVRVTMAYEVSLAWWEGHNEDGEPHGSNDGGNSFCWGQIYLPHGAHTREGWSGRELVADPQKCASVVVRILKDSVTRGPADCPLCLYARGRVTPEARGLSRHRVELARRLLREVPWPEVVQPIDAYQTASVSP